MKTTSKKPTQKQIIADLQEKLHAASDELSAFKKRAFEDWAGEYFGSVGVDSGQILVADPCYVETPHFGPDRYREACTASDGDGTGPMCGLIDLPSVGKYAQAFITATADGDGSASIYVKRKEGSKRPKRITIVLP